jgi:hypothetical protein
VSRPGVVETIVRVMRTLPTGNYAPSDYYALIERAHGSPVKTATVSACTSRVCLVSAGVRWREQEGLTISPGAKIGSHKDYLSYDRQVRLRSRQEKLREEERRRQERPPSVAPDPPAVLFPPERTPPIYEELWVGEDVLVLRRETGREVLARIIR